MDPLCTGRWRCRHTLGSVRIASIMRGVTYRGCGLAKRMRSMPGTSLTRPRRSAKSRAGASGDRYRFTICPRSCTSRAPRVRGASDVRQDVGDRPHPLVAARIRDDAERAEFVAAFDDGDVRLERIRTARDPQRKRHVVVRIEIHLRGARRLTRIFHEHRQPLEALRAHEHVDDVTVGPLEQPRTFLLRDTSGDGDDGPLPCFLTQDAQLPKPRVELLFRFLAHAARVDHHEVGVAIVGGPLVAGLLEQTRHALGVVLVHLAAERFNQVPARHLLLNHRHQARQRLRHRSNKRRPDGTGSPWLRYFRCFFVSRLWSP